MTNKPLGKLTLDCDEREKKLLDIIRKTEYGEIKIIVQDGIPVRIEEIKKSIKL